MKRKIFLLAILLVVGIVLFRGACPSKKSIVTFKVAKGEFTSSVFATGAIVPVKLVNLSTPSGGVVRHIIKEGRGIKKGEVVVKLDDSEAKAQYEKAEANFESAARNLRNMEKLFEEKAVTQEKLEMARTEFSVAEAHLELTRTRLAATQILSPINGTVAKVRLSQGEMAMPGSPIATIVDISKTLVKVNIDNTDVGRVKEGQTVRVKVNAFPDKEFSAHVVKVALIGDREARTEAMVGARSSFETILELDEPQSGFRPGMNVTSEIVVAKKEKTYYIPIEALVGKNGKKGVWLVKGKFAQFKEVKVGLFSDNYIEIIDGIKEGNRIVKDALGFKQDPSKVKIPIAIKKK